MERIKNLFLTLFFSLYSLNSHALETAFAISFSIGGDTLVTYTDGTKLKAGDGSTFSLDLTHAINETLAITSSIGYKFKNQEVTSGGSVNLNSMPISIGTKFMFSPKLGLGVGGISQLSSKYSLPTSSTTITSNMGLYAEFLYKINRKLEFGLRNISGLTAKSDSTQKIIDASHISLILRSVF